MQTHEFEDTWANVDRTAEPVSCVHFLDTVNAMKDYQTYKRRSIECLDIREGQHILEVGCGAGDETRLLAQMVGRTGRVVGVDNSATMIAEARRRVAGSDLPVEYYAQDAHHLDFADNSFDGCRADRILLHVVDPQRVLAEMIRVVRPKGRIVISEIDWGTHIVDARDCAVTRKILGAMCDNGIRNGWIGRHLLSLFKASELTGIEVGANVLIFTDYEQRREVMCEAMETARDAGVVSAFETDSWFADIKQRGEAGLFFESVNVYTASGCKP